MNNIANTLVIPVLAIAAVTVLVALGRLEAAVAVPIIVGLAGVHIGANAGNNTPPQPPQTTVTATKPEPPTV